MQTPRERMLTMGLLLAILVAGGGFVGYLLLWQPVEERNDTIASLEKELEEGEERLRQIDKDMPRLKQQIQRSLPADVNMARREYEIRLNQLLRDSDFVATSIIIDPRPADTTNSPLLAKNKPIYSRLSFVVQVRGELVNLTDFLAGFHKMHLLHQVKKISMQQLATTKAGEKENQLDINLTIEALVLDVAEKRPTLLPSNAVSMRILAEPDREYGSIAGRDLFNGPPPPPPPTREVKVEEKPEVDLTPFIRLTSITHEDMPPSEELSGLMGIAGGGGVFTPQRPAKSRADLFDFYNRYEFSLEQDSKGGSIVSGYYYIGERKKQLDKGQFLVIGEEDAKNRMFFRVVKIDTTDLILQKLDMKGRRNAIGVVGGGLASLQYQEPMYRWHVGDLLKDVTKVPPDEARRLAKLVKPVELPKAPQGGRFGR